MENPEKLAAQGTQEKQQNMCWTPQYANLSFIISNWL